MISYVTFIHFGCSVSSFILFICCGVEGYIIKISTVLWDILHYFFGPGSFLDVKYKLDESAAEIAFFSLYIIMCPDFTCLQFSTVPQA